MMCREVHNKYFGCGNMFCKYCINRKIVILYNINDVD